MGTFARVRGCCLVLACAAGLACSSTGSGSDADAGSGGGSGGGSGSGSGSSSCTPQSVKGACIVLPVDSGTSIGSCVEYTGSGFTTAAIQQVCGSPVLDACPTANRVGGACVFECGQVNEAVDYDYGGITASEVEQGCASQHGDYQP
jgi:hypothetical protein